MKSGSENKLAKKKKKNQNENKLKILVKKY
jgi:hypothetical protein